MVDGVEFGRNLFSIETICNATGYSFDDVKVRGGKSRYLLISQSMAT